jgi:hypothetical protein
MQVTRAVENLMEVLTKVFDDLSVSVALGFYGFWIDLYQSVG